MSGSWTEASPLDPNSPYSAAKAGGDLIALAYARTHGLSVSITRCCNNYGPYQYPEKVIPLFVTNLLDGKPVPLYGDGPNVRSWIHVDDHCRGIQLVLERGDAGRVYNVDRLVRRQPGLVGAPPPTRPAWISAVIGEPLANSPLVGMGGRGYQRRIATRSLGGHAPRLTASLVGFRLGRSRPLVKDREGPVIPGDRYGDAVDRSRVAALEAQVRSPDLVLCRHQHQGGPAILPGNSRSTLSLPPCGVGARVEADDLRQTDIPCTYAGRNPRQAAGENQVRRLVLLCQLYA
jgi:hypothetical protein